MAFDDTGDGGKPECPFTEGDLVRLKSGGPPLVVGSVQDGFVLDVHWFDGAVLRTDMLPAWCFVGIDDHST